MCKNRHGTYYARFIIPKHLQSHFNNKREIRRSLQTDSRKIATKRARIYRVEFESIVDQLMTNPDSTKERAKRIVDNLFADKTKTEKDATEQFAERMRNNATQSNDDFSKTQYITFLDAFDKLVTINTGDDEQDAKIYQMIKPALNEAGLAQREKRAEELHQAQLAAIAEQPTPAPTKSTNPKKLSAYLEDYIEYQTAPSTKDGWNSPSTIKNMTKALKIFCSDVGDIPAAAFGWDEAKQYIKLAHNIPVYFRNKTHGWKFEGITIESILDDNIDTSKFKTRKPSTVWGDLKIVRSLLEWIRSEERVKELQDAVEALDKAIRRIDPKSKRRAFTPEELKTLFEQDNPATENYVKGFNSKRGINASLKYWLPLLGLYTGATLAELCQLHLSDIRLHKAFDGSEHWVIDMNKEAEKCAIDQDIRFKTESRPRRLSD
ncbi:DUF6538 domain-containing protein [Methylobacter tundripaludum]|nr:DUF6538 domain-containing protein [Methylobacter tundripaludum]